MHLIVMAKEPRPGRVKTRLCPPCSPDQAAEVAAAALADTLAAVAACGADRRIVALDGEPGPWLPPGFEVIPQRGDGLAARLARAWADADGGGLQIGMDTPQLGATDLDRALAAVVDVGPGGAVLGPAADGGWWALGTLLPHPEMFDRVPMSATDTGERQRQQLERLGRTVDLLDEHRDIDTFADLLAVAATMPSGRTPAVADGLRGLVSAGDAVGESGDGR